MTERWSTATRCPKCRRIQLGAWCRKCEAVCTVCGQRFERFNKYGLICLPCTSAALRERAKENCGFKKESEK